MVDTQTTGGIEEGWDAPERGASMGAEFLRLKDGDKAAVRFLGVPVKYKDHWLQGENRSAMCTKALTGYCAVCDDGTRSGRDRSPRTKFGVVVFLHAMKVPGAQNWEKLGEVRVFEQGMGCLISMKSAIDEVADNGGKWQETDFTIQRLGSGTDTKYTVMPRPRATAVPAGVEVPDIKAVYLARMQKVADNGAAPAKSLAAIDAEHAAKNGNGNGSGLREVQPGEFGDPLAEDGDVFEDQ